MSFSRWLVRQILVRPSVGYDSAMERNNLGGSQGPEQNEQSQPQKVTHYDSIYMTFSKQQDYSCGEQVRDGSREGTGVTMWCPNSSVY